MEQMLCSMFNTDSGVPAEDKDSDGQSGEQRSSGVEERSGHGGGQVFGAEQELQARQHPLGLPLRVEHRVLPESSGHQPARSEDGLGLQLQSKLSHQALGRHQSCRYEVQVNFLRVKYSIRNVNIRVGLLGQDTTTTQEEEQQHSQHWHWAHSNDCDHYYQLLLLCQTYTHTNHPSHTYNGSHL